MEIPKDKVLELLRERLGLDDVLAIDAAQQRGARVQLLQRDRPQAISLHAAAVWRARAARSHIRVSGRGTGRPRCRHR